MADAGTRKKTKAVKVGQLIIGGGFPISVQTMWKKPIISIGNNKNGDYWHQLAKKGCQAIRFAIPDESSIRSLAEFISVIPMPVIADIHFDYRLALMCMDIPIHKLRINPGNIGAKWKVIEVVNKAKDKQIPIRIGVNSGSLPRRLRLEKDIAKAMLRAAEEEINIFTQLRFNDIVVSLKSSSVDETITANRMFSHEYDYPLHLGVTEAGPTITGTVKNTAALVPLLKEGIGDTVRVSLSAPVESEITAGKEILRIAGHMSKGVEIISCPTCGRTQYDVFKMIDMVSEITPEIDKAVTIAIMGCPVNGPQEAKKADIGITGAGNDIIIFRGGKVIKRVPFNNAFTALREEIDKL